MKKNTKAKQGSVLLLSLIVMMVAVTVAAAVVAGAMQEYRLTRNSSARLQALHSAEAGVALACKELGAQFSGDSAWGSWTGSGSTRSYTGSLNSFSSCDVNVTALSGNEYEITAIGQVVLASFDNPIQRTVQVLVTPEGSGSYPYGFAALDEMNTGNGTYNSYDPVTGQYGQNAVITCMGDIEAGPGTQIEGSVSAPDGATVDLDEDQVTGNITYDADFEFPSVVVPPELLAIEEPEPQIKTTQTFDASDFPMSVSSIKLNKGSITIQGSGVCRLYVEDFIALGGNAQIFINPDSGADLKLEIYSNGDVDLGGGGVVNNTGLAKNFILYGTVNCDSMSFSGTSAHTGVVYAPTADLVFNGTGEESSVYTGSFAGKTITVNGDVRITCDESLSDDENGGLTGNLVFVSWAEL